MFLIGMLFVILTLSDMRSAGYILLGLGLGISFMLLGLMFVWSVATSEPVVIMMDEGIWTQGFKKTVAWNDLLDVRIESGLLIVELGKRSLAKNFPDASYASKALLGLSSWDLSLTNAKPPQLAAAIEEKLRR